MKHLTYIISLMAFLMVCSCSHIDELERYIYVEPASVARTVLIEEFTGQRCVNCPNAAEEILRIQQQYGETNVIAVSIHAGPLAVFPSSQTKGLRTELGDIYYDHWGVEVEPSGLVDRKGGLSLSDQWQTLVHQGLQQQAPLMMDATCTMGSDGEVDIQLSVHLTADVKGRVQVWLTEDNIVAPQMMPDGTMNSEYLHQHVLRAAVNGTWGEDVNWKQGDSELLTYRYKPEAEWNLSQLSVVAFVYDDSGVLQVCKQGIIIIN